MIRFDLCLGSVARIALFTLPVLYCTGYCIVNAKMLTSLLIAAVLSGGIKVGEHAPDFTVTAHTKEKVSLSDFKGQKVILWFYPRASTGG